MSFCDVIKWLFYVGAAIPWVLIFCATAPFFQRRPKDDD